MPVTQTLSVESYMELKKQITWY